MKLTQQQIRQALISQSPDPRAFAEKNEAWMPGYRKKETKPRERPEDDLQRQCVEYLQYHPDIFFFHPLQNMYRGKNANEGAFLAYMVRMKRMGYKSGIPDLILWFKDCHGTAKTLLLELKAGRNDLTDNQKEIFKHAKNAGCYTGVVCSINDLRIALRDAGHIRHQNGMLSSNGF